jgi:hypothetical protein
MEDFDELCRLYSEWRSRNRDYALQATKFVTRFAAEVARQIAAPDAFGNDKKVSYVRPLKFDPQTNRFNLLELHDILVWDDDDGSWHGGVGIHLEPGGRASFPKTEFTIRLRFKLHDNDCELQIASGTFELKIDDRSSWASAIEGTVSALVHNFKLKPWESYQQKQRIGFMWQDKGPQPT